MPKTPSQSTRVTHTTPSNQQIIIKYKEILDETYNAWLLTIHNRDVWLPKRSCVLVSKHNVIAVPVWLARNEKLIMVIRTLKPRGEKLIGTRPTMMTWYRKVPMSDTTHNKTDRK